MATADEVIRALERRRGRQIGRTLGAIENHAPHLTGPGHPVRSAVLGEINDTHRIVVEILRSFARDDVEINTAWLEAIMAPTGGDDGHGG